MAEPWDLCADLLVAGARLISKTGAPISGLYAAGKATASVMGQTYADPGSTTGPAVVSGFIAGRYAAASGQNSRRTIAVAGQ